MTCGIPDIDDYCTAVMSGERIANRYEKRAVERFIRDLETQTEFYFEPKAALHVFRFLEKLRHYKGQWAGQQFKLEGWQKFIVGNLFGWLRKSDKIRRFREGYIEVPRKNGKTLLTAGIGLYGMHWDAEPGAEIYSAATSRDQAKLLWEDARVMLLGSPDVTGFKTTVGNNTISHSVNNAKFRPLSKDHGRLDGLNIHMALMDELHAWKQRDLYDVINTATGARSKPLLISITTAGVVYGGIAQETRTYLTKILDGVTENERFFGIIYSIDEGDLEHWDQEWVWKKANPNYGVSILPDGIAADAAKAVESLGERNNFLTKRLNVWVSAYTSWMNMQKWDKCKAPEQTWAELEGKPCYVSMDLSSKKDLCCVGAMYWHEDKLSFLVKSYMPEHTLMQREARLRKQFEVWREMGHLTVTEGEVNDYEIILQDITQIVKTGKVLKIGYDPYQANQMAMTMHKLGYPIVEIRQQVSTLSEPMKNLEACVLDGGFRHNNPLLSWCVSNITAKTDKKENIFPGKDSPILRIDAGVTAIMCMAMHVSEALPKTGGKKKLRVWTV